MNENLNSNVSWGELSETEVDQNVGRLKAMSKLRHNNVRRYEIILMVVVAQSLLLSPCIANSIEYYGKWLTPRPQSEDRPIEWQLQNRLSSNPQALFKELDKFTTKKFVPVANAKREEYINSDQKLNRKTDCKKKKSSNWTSNYPQSRKNSYCKYSPVYVPKVKSKSFETLEHERQRNQEILQNAIADREFERMMQLKHKLQVENKKSASASERSKSSKTSNKKCLAQTVLLKKSKAMAKAKAAAKPKNKSALPKLLGITSACTTCTTTCATTAPPTTTTTTTPCPPTQQTTVCPLTYLQSIRRRARVIIKSCNKLEMLIKKCALQNSENSGSEDRLHNKVDEITKSFERLEKPQVVNISHSKDSVNHRGFYFGLSPPGVAETDENIEKSQKEQQKLEEKVREEYQMQRNARRIARKNRSRLQRLENKKKRARYEAAPPGAARLEQMVTTAPSKGTQNYPQAKQLKESIVNQLKNMMNIHVRRNNIRLAYRKLQKRKRNLAKKIKNSKSSKRTLALFKRSLTKHKTNDAVKCELTPPMVREKRRRRQIRRLRQRLTLNNKH